MNDRFHGSEGDQSNVRTFEGRPSLSSITSPNRSRRYRDRVQDRQRVATAVSNSSPTRHDAALVLFRCDLRLADQPALVAACAAHERVLPVHLHAPHEEAPWGPGAASRWWLHPSLEALQQRLAAQGATLHVARGDRLPTLRAPAPGA
ncbi:deoxyribodipyrimidine photo-lyase [Rhodanobacter aciditrophus]|uniref:deoxyribodipyrimidine photo-lyase n=1 Tax=Rhodanobacter aciditrophus TaxID=1623218 RepID=UPI003CEE1F08